MQYFGVPANAPEAEISGGRSARAGQGLHPDSKPASEREQAHREFNLLTEAYDTLKDAERREAYDEELKLRAQLTRVESKGRPPGRFRHGARIRSSPRGRRHWCEVLFGPAARTPKNQDSLRITKVPAAAAVTAPRPAESGKGAAPTALAARGWQRRPNRRSPRRRDRTGLRRRRPARPSRRASAPGHGRRCPCHGSNPSAARAALSICGRVLSLESQTNSDAGGVAVYRLVSLVNSSTAIDELSEAASLATRPETVDLIRGRIAALKEEQGRQPPASAKPQDLPCNRARPAAGRPPAGRHLRRCNRRPRRRDDLEAASGNGLKESFSDCGSCPEMVTVPGGQTVIGARPEAPGYRPEEGPAHKIAIQRPFAVSKHGISAEIGEPAWTRASACRPWPRT